jgi:hypothetical protein
MNTVYGDIKNSDAIIAFSKEYVIREIDGIKACTIDMRMDLSTGSPEIVKDIREALNDGNGFHEVSVTEEGIVTAFVTDFALINDLLNKK